jgi:hypothetical protein
MLERARPHQRLGETEARPTGLLTLVEENPERFVNAQRALNIASCEGVSHVAPSE